MLAGTGPVFSAGHDFADYRQWLEAIGIDTSLVTIVPDKLTARHFCNTHRHNSEISSFYSGAVLHAAELSFRTIEGPGLVIVSPNDPAAILEYAEE